eukprot:TRINITY_DN0_c1143_g1_i1.p1 TRINITY_DN0_c1143_g1~~TRINITY_DN0_c1143_g1_i1.p1  ORF type:complete len:135 (+),score=40.44 TRINITY_DN0_c1143_g1_i1:1-405(+)
MCIRDSSKPSRSVYCLDGDGAFLMHMGAATTIGQTKAANYRHIVLNNGAHDSVGAQPTVGYSVDLCSIAMASGYAAAATVSSEDELRKALAEQRKVKGPTFLEVRIRPGARVDLGRPKTSTLANKQGFMEFLRI